MKALVAYGTRYGSTTDIADRIGKILKQKGTDVDIINLHKKDIAGVSDYDIVVVGSGIKMGGWTGKALRFLERHESQLVDKKVALFVSCMDVINVDKRGEAKQKYLIDIANKYTSIEPMKLGLFGGVIDVNKYGFGTRFLLKVLSKELEKDGIDVNKPNDFRNWDEIEKWARELLPE